MRCLKVRSLVRPKVYYKRGAASYGNGGYNNAGGSGNDEDGSSMGSNPTGSTGSEDIPLLVPVIEGIEQEAQPLPDPTRPRVSTKGQSWLRKLGTALESEGLTVESLPDGYKLVGVIREQEYQFYPGFELSQLPADTNLELGLEIVRSKGLQRMLVDYADDKPLTTLKRLWNKWQRGLQKGLYARAGSFTSYVGENGFRVSVEGANILLTQVIPDWDSLSQREKVEVLLATTEPDLLAKLPERFREELADLLDQPNLIANSPYIEVAREPLIRRVNQRLGYQLRDLAEFRQLIGLVRQNSSRGAIAETFVRRFLVGGLTGSQESRKPYFPKENYGGDKNIQPDMLRPLNRRTLDVKVGYSEGDIDGDQLARYAKLVRASENPGNQELYQQLLELGVEGGELEGHDYLILPNDKDKARAAALKAYNLIRKNGLLRTVAIYFVGKYPSADKITKEGIYLVELDLETKEPGVRLIGEKLPD